MFHSVLHSNISLLTDAVGPDASADLSMYSGPSDLPLPEKPTGHSEASLSQHSSPQAGVASSQESDISERILVSYRSFPLTLRAIILMIICPIGVMWE